MKNLRQKIAALRQARREKRLKGQQAKQDVRNQAAETLAVAAARKAVQEIQVLTDPGARDGFSPSQAGEAAVRLCNARTALSSFFVNQCEALPLSMNKDGTIDWVTMGEAQKERAVQYLAKVDLTAEQYVKLMTDKDQLPAPQVPDIDPKVWNESPVLSAAQPQDAAVPQTPQAFNPRSVFNPTFSTQGASPAGRAEMLDVNESPYVPHGIQGTKSMQEAANARVG